jgi:hypothetical protein
MRTRLALTLLAVVSALLLAPPLSASAGSPVFDRAEPTKLLGFVGTFPGTLASEGAPAITCEVAHVTGSFAPESGTNGSLQLDYTGCHFFLMGITFACKSKGAPVTNTILMPETPFELTYLTDNKLHPGILIKGIDTEIVCNGWNITIKGDLMGTMTVPGCGATTRTFTLAFRTTSGGVIQEHQQVTGTGTHHDLSSTPEGEEEHTFGLNADTTLSFNQLATLTCV